MSKMRIYELAKQLGVANKDLMEKMKSIGLEANSHMSMVSEADAEKITALYQPAAQKAEEKKEEKKAAPAQQKKQNAPKQEASRQKPQEKQKPQDRQEKKDGQEQKNRGDRKPQDSRPAQNNQNQKNRPNNQSAQNGQNNQNQGKKDKKGKGKKDQKPRENPMERRRREMEEEAALMAELEALEAAEKAANADPVIKTIPATISVKELAEVLGKKGSDLVMALMKKGQMLNINATLDFDSAAAIAEDYNVILEKEEEKDIMETVFAEEEDDEKDLQERPPVVVVMGHVDHGKTSLLDAIRHSNVTKGEAGGITQHIGAYTVQIDGKPITFLDTPGHEAFTAMRMRGAQITDIAVLVVAADDGVMPQTVEAINHAKAAGVEIIVAINKMDKPSANPDRVKQELVEYELLAEDWGGQTICVPVSAATKEGIDTLLEMITLVAEMKELKANPKKKARGAIVEAQLDKGRGPVATVLVQNGTLQVGDPIVAGAAYGKIRAMTDDKGRRVKKAGPSTPVEILGLSEVPSAGDSFYVAESEKQARQVAESIIAKNRENLIKETPQKVSLDDLFSQIQSGNMKELNIVVKADVQGSVEAVRQSLERLSNEEVRVRIIHGGVGAITESDVMLASASNAIIIGFNVRPEPAAKAFADEEKVDVRLYRVIYNAIEDVTAAMKGMLDPVFEEQVQGHAEVRQLFKASGVGTIAGCYVKDGKFTRSSQVRIIRDGIVVYEGDLESLKRFKDDVKEVAAGYECGLVFKKFNDVKEGDWVEAFTMVEVPR
ncbi:translation initiation factor IF-2 [Anaerotignum lactatifermentans]|uniref:Translation initiation factor IF-2 n=1 Tax=Anaerotignum lactatifermentans TaxID=160404 RepID=A0ABS2G5K7_9FIRM|nr:translation initiation factor IF-2 [Anaerotignum lactatifermentans]MBM6828138.1 translation initiation factor IF-2 [Anaerotignum lactatifermentans]MBM6876699.1 translation initiation factor IF-2 [Anaerotignum lactatifermentans]MBM6949721.1 translation initiation factor IF-2 [Anaerotignum lactatifermentans]